MPGQKFSRDSNAPRARLSIQYGQRAAATIGATRVRQLGVAFLQVFVPEGGGTKVANDAGDNLALIFDNESLAFLDGTGWIITKQAESVGNLEREGYTQHNFSITFTHDQDS